MYNSILDNYSTLTSIICSSSADGTYPTLPASLQSSILFSLRQKNLFEKITYNKFSNTHF